MYICRESNTPIHKFVKCQTLKPYMLGNGPIQHYCDETPDILRNPFQHITRIDCDKLFITDKVQYDTKLRTTTRPDICKDLFSNILSELEKDGYQLETLNETELERLNPLINFYST